MAQKPDLKLIARHTISGRENRFMKDLQRKEWLSQQMQCTTNIFANLQSIPRFRRSTNGVLFIYKLFPNYFLRSYDRCFFNIQYISVISAIAHDLKAMDCNKMEPAEPRAQKVSLLTMMRDIFTTSSFFEGNVLKYINYAELTSSYVPPSFEKTLILTTFQMKW